MSKKQTKSNTSVFSLKRKVPTLVLHSLITVFAIIAAAMLTRFLVKFKDTWYLVDVNSKWWSKDAEIAWYLAIPATIFMWALVLVSGIMYIKVASIFCGKDKAKVMESYQSLKKFNVAFVALMVIAFAALVATCVIAGRKSIDIDGDKMSPIDEYWPKILSGYNCREMLIASTVFAGINVGVLSAMVNITKRITK